MVDSFPDLSMVAFAISHIFSLLNSCEAIESKNYAVTKAIDAITEQQVEFHINACKFIGWMKTLKHHAKDIQNYVEFKDQENTLENERSKLTILLDDSKEIRAYCRILKNSFDQIRESLLKIHKELSTYEYSLPDSEIERKAKKKELKDLNKIFTIKNTVAVILFLVSFVFNTIPTIFYLASFVFNKVPKLDYFHLFSFVFLVAGIYVYYGAKSDRKIILQIEDELDVMNEILDNNLENIKILKRTLYSIIRCIIEFEVICEVQENRISYLIRNLELNGNLDNDNSVHMTIALIRIKWYGV
ncbi:12129_t:CDS:1 [Acaulospora morrowiae]|uniref:12129_t:CDS:1 n=1 Tax=Acaulospora morrowiae TaxID=94023 RepID=A0A9N9BRN4_9GLOM|nr:12129_t:CDS:1 [Acaulospora morrowiae]